MEEEICDDKNTLLNPSRGGEARFAFPLTRTERDQTGSLFPIPDVTSFQDKQRKYAEES